MPRLIGLTGDGAAAEAMRQIDPDVVAAYPITPQTEIVERFAEFVADGLVNTEFVAVESEHSAMSACCGSAAAGARTITCTSSQGLALMHEVLYIAAGNRLPIVLINVNRTLSAPLNIHCDHSDSMGSRDSGWIQLYCENVQEVYDTVIQAVRIAEHPQVMLPVMVNLDGFVLSHSVERLELLDDEQVREFVGPFRPVVDLLDLEHPPALGALVAPEFHFEHKYAQWLAIDGARAVIEGVGREFGERFGRSYGLLDPYRLEDADLALVVLGSTAGTARAVVDDLRERGIRAGMLRIRCYRPFPADEIVEALKGKKAVAIMDRAGTQGGEGGPVFGEVRAALYTRGVFLPVINYIYGLGGRDVPAASVARVFTHLGQVAEAGKVDRAVNYLDLRGWN